MPELHSGGPSAVRQQAPLTALVLIDVINALDFPGSEALVKRAQIAAVAIDALAARARTQGVPVIYANDKFGQWRSDFRQTVELRTDARFRVARACRLYRSQFRRDLRASAGSLVRGHPLRDATVGGCEALVSTNLAFRTQRCRARRLHLPSAMESKVQVLGHPVHQVAVALPIGALTFAVTSDALERVSGRDEFAIAAKLALDFGLISAVVAAPFGAVDWFAIEPGTRAKRVGLWHAVGNLGVLAIFLAARLLRRDGKSNGSGKLLAVAGLGLVAVTSWLGGELVNRHGVGVHDVMGLNAPSSFGKARKYHKPN